jgi:hypothetical protein
MKEHHYIKNNLFAGSAGTIPKGFFGRQCEYLVKQPLVSNYFSGDAT